jgi:hypothetical protein
VLDAEMAVMCSLPPKADCRPIATVDARSQQIAHACRPAVARTEGLAAALVPSGGDVEEIGHR